MNPLQKLRPLVQLVPAAAVAAAVLLTLPGTEPTLAAVPERLSAPVETTHESAAAVEEVEEEEVLPKLPYPDGVYVGSSRGYGGPVKVQVTMENGAITDVQILSASGETSAFLKRARRLLTTVVAEQSWEVDAISEATYTSRGILGAVRNALTGEVVNNPRPPQPEPAAPLETVEMPELPELEETPNGEDGASEEGNTPSFRYLDGVYTASAQGFGGPITVQITVQSDAITDITLVSHSGETTSYFSRARKVVSAILETGSPAGVDSVSGATYSSTGILNAVKLALAKAVAVPAPAETPTETPAEGPASSEAEVPEPPETPAETPAEETPASEPTELAASSVPEEQPAASESAPSSEPETPSFWEQAVDTLTTLFEERGASSSSSSAPTVVFRPAESEPPASAAASEVPAETEGTTE